MLDSHKLLYILPDVTYVVELLPGKKDHSFAVHNFRQINGEFLDDNEFIPENIEKLFGKLEEGPYHIILPDFLFTNTIVEIAESSEAKVKDHIKDKLLPSLDLSKETHELKTFILTERAGKFKVQLAALEKSVMEPVSSASEANSVKISGITPLSWTLKSVISLEPSISLLQMGSKVYLAQHYIGVDQANQADVSEIDTLAETIKTLKGVEPSIQTIYLLTNELVEAKLKELVSSTLPIQQLASFKEDDAEMPSYVRFAVESGMKTLSIEEYAAPSFALPTASQARALAVAPKPVESVPVIGDDESDQAVEIKDLDSDSDTELPKPSLVAPAASTAVSATLATPSPVEELEPPVEVKSTSIDLDEEEESEEEVVGEVQTETETKVEDQKTEPEVVAVQKEVEPAKPEPNLGETDNGKAVEESPTLTQFAATSTTPETKVLNQTVTSTLIKNKSNVQPMIKMVAIAVAVFLVTVGIGVGIGFALIQYNNQKETSSETQKSPLATPDTTPTPTPLPSPQATATSSATVSDSFDPSKFSILVVNATTKAGYAGTIKKELETAKFKNITAGNAKGTYEKGNYILMAETNAELQTALENALSIDVSMSDETKVEDSADKYDAIVVLAE